MGKITTKRKESNLQNALKSTRQKAARIPDHVQPLLHRLMAPGSPALDMTEWDIVRAYNQTFEGQGGKKAAKKPRKKKTPRAT